MNVLGSAGDVNLKHFLLLVGLLALALLALVLGGVELAVAAAG